MILYTHMKRRKLVYKNHNYIRPCRMSKQLRYYWRNRGAILARAHAKVVRAKEEAKKKIMEVEVARKKQFEAILRKNKAAALKRKKEQERIKTIVVDGERFRYRMNTHPENTFGDYVEMQNSWGEWVMYDDYISEEQLEGVIRYNMQQYAEDEGLTSLWA